MTRPKSQDAHDLQEKMNFINTEENKLDTKDATRIDEEQKNDYSEEFDQNSGMENY